MKKRFGHCWTFQRLLSAQISNTINSVQVDYINTSLTLFETKYLWRYANGLMFTKTLVLEFKQIIMAGHICV